ncbi:MAG: carboxypeptidase-like regulatory domain-containing protein, partial [Prevotella nanceiensis]|nr:carboxypeptidase-like regulatory domain-containing protein [Hoylesella nanceiensis]
MYRFTKANRLFAIALLLFCVLSVSAQIQGTISGTVKNEQGETLMGALVQVLETKEKVVTNIDGHFTIKATTGQTLQASYLGMLTQKVKIGNHSLTIVLKNDSRQIDEVVVTGYQNIRNRVYTGAATSVKMDDIKLEGIAD